MIGSTCVTDFIILKMAEKMPLINTNVKSIDGTWSIAGPRKQDFWRINRPLDDQINLRTLNSGVCRI